ncbi:MAG: hypothetical protein KAJ19_12155, partial [Gammaproteobacteria bacterium]|nr:hypothetical protein [Gammaproteobacteria bacterium]
MTRPLITRPGQTPSTSGRLSAPSDHAIITNAARGIPDRADTTLSFDDGTRTFTITPVSGAFSYYIAGRRYIKSAAESVVIADTSGPHWIYYDGATLTSVVNAGHEAVDDLIVNKVRIGIVYWNATDGAGHLVADERHGTEMSGATQEWYHDSVGAVWHDGLSLSDYALNTDTDAGVTFKVTDGSIRDEDLEHDIVDGAPATQYAQQLNGGNAEVPIAYRDDVDGSWTQDAATTLPYKRFGAGRLAYNKNDGDGTWSQVEVTNNRFVLATLVATNDWQYPIKMVQGQAEYTDKKTAIEEANAEQVAWGTMITPEIVPLYRLVMETGDGLGGTNKCRIVAVTDLRRLSLTGGQAVPAEPHAILNGGTHSDTLAAAVVRGDLQIGNATPVWARLALGAAGTYPRSDGSDLVYSNEVATHLADTSDPHGSTMGVTVALQTPLVQMINADLTLDAQASYGDTTVYVLNSFPGNAADLDVEKDIIVGGTVDGRDVAADGAVLDTAVLEMDVDAKGDIFVATANDTLIRLPIGADTHVLTADSGEASGVKWAAGGAGAGAHDILDVATHTDSV